MVSVDLKDAFLLVPIHLESRKLLRFEWKGEELSVSMSPV